MALSRVLEGSCRLNVYIRQPGGHVKPMSVDAWGFSQVTGHKCLVVRDARSLKVHVLGNVVRRSQFSDTDVSLLNRVRVVEESITSSGRSEWEFYIEEVDEVTIGHVLRGPILEPSAVVGGGIRL